MKVLPYDACPKCGSDYLVIAAERIHGLDGVLVDDSAEQISSGELLCAESCGNVAKLVGLGSAAADNLDRVQATLDRAADRRDKLPCQSCGGPRPCFCHA